MLALLSRDRLVPGEYEEGEAQTAAGHSITARRLCGWIMEEVAEDDSDEAVHHGRCRRRDATTGGRRVSAFLHRSPADSHRSNDDSLVILLQRSQFPMRQSLVADADCGHGKCRRSQCCGTYSFIESITLGTQDAVRPYAHTSVSTIAPQKEQEKLVKDEEKRQKAEEREKRKKEKEVKDQVKAVEKAKKDEEAAKKERVSGGIRIPPSVLTNQ
ncbi:hypothetical protein MRB53_041367 [Persea americana]|nr:hypothetical protein MRB53_041367 [Persea americana]